MFDIIRNLYTREDYGWINEIEEEYLSNITLFHYLISDNSTYVRIRCLSKYIYDVPFKIFVALLHGNISKKRRAPFLEGLKKIAVGEELIDELMNKIRIYFRNSEKEFLYISPLILQYIEKDKIDWFKKFGIKTGGKKNVIG